MPTGAGSKVYAELYGDRNETAVSMARLIELGGQLVGKTKTASYVCKPESNICLPLRRFAVGSEGVSQAGSGTILLLIWTARGDCRAAIVRLNLTTPFSNLTDLGWLVLGRLEPTCGNLVWDLLPDRVARWEHIHGLTLPLVLTPQVRFCQDREGMGPD